MEFILILSLFILLFAAENSTPEQVKRVIEKLSEDYSVVDVNISALTILIDEKYSKEYIVNYYPKISKIISSYNLYHNDDIYKHKSDFLYKVEKLRDIQAERIETEKREKRLLKFFIIATTPFIIYALFHIPSAIEETKAQQRITRDTAILKDYGSEIEQAFTQAANDGDTAITIAELSDNVGKVYLPTDLNFNGNKFYISDIEGFDSYALIDNTNVCDYTYTYDELVNRVKKYQFEYGCYDGKFFAKVKPIQSEEEIESEKIDDIKEELIKLREEVKYLRSEKANQI